MLRFVRLAAAAVTVFSIGSAQALPERISVDRAEALVRLKANAAGGLAQQTRSGSASVMVRATGARPLMADGGAGRPLDRAAMFLSVYGAAVGVTRPVAELAPQRQSRDSAGLTHVHLDQVHRGLPVFGARLVVHMDGAGVRGVSGAFVPGLAGLPTTPARELSSVRAAALAFSGKFNRRGDLRVESGRWVIYPVGLLQGRLREARLAYEALVTGAGGAVRERVFVDGVNGEVLDRINLVQHALNREIYTPDQTLAPALTEGGLFAPVDPALVNDPGYASTDVSGDAPGVPTSNLYVFAGGTYKLYENMFGRKGYDACDAGGDCQPDQAGPAWSPVRGTDYVGQIQKSVYLVNENCPNAYWDGDATNYCPGFDADDVVSHEWSHAYTQYTHGLIYAYQSGALNESYSDIFGETYDLVNNIEGPLGGLTLTEHYYYEDAGSRWVVGEDLSEVAASLLLRDMWKPDDFPAANPGKTTSPNYACGSGDGGGVHANSSVSNHAYAILVDGTAGQGPAGTTGLERDSYNGQSFTGIGLIKAAHIYFHAMNNYQTPTTDFPQHANALRASCQDLKGVNLKGPTGALSGQVIAQADCDKLDQAMLATQMDLGTPCPYIPVLAQGAPAVCAGALDAFAENWEDGDTGWTKTSTGVYAEWEDASRPLRDFVLKSDDLPDDRAGTVAFADNIPVGEPGGGNCQTGGDYSGEFTFDSPAFTIPASASGSKLRFDHYVATEATADGGQLEINVNNAGFTLVDQADYLFNPPNSALLGPVDLSNNPNGGEYAWNGADINAPSGSPASRWGTTIVDLGALAQPDDVVQLRFKFTQEGCNGTDGWYIDNIRAYSCPSLAAPTLSLGGDYENPDSNGSFTLNWVRPPTAGGPDLLQKSTTACAPLLSSTADALTGWTAVSSAPPLAPAWTTSLTKPGHEGNSAFWANPTAEQETQGTNATLTWGTPIVLPAGVNTLTFSEFYFNEDDDKGTVEVSTDGGTTWTTIYTNNRPMGGLPDEGITALATEDLSPTSIDLSPFSGQTIGLRFNFQLGDSNYYLFTQYGWYIDDIAITNETWGDVLTTAASTATLANQLDGTACFRVQTTYSIAGQPVASLFSNIVSATVVAGLANLPPVAVAGLDRTVRQDTRVELDGSASLDPNGEPLTYAWTQVAGTPVTLADAGSARPSFTAPAAGTTLVFQLEVSDAAGASSVDSVNVTVTRGGVGNNVLGGALPLGSLLLLAGALGLRRRRFARA